MMRELRRPAWCVFPCDSAIVKSVAMVLNYTSDQPNYTYGPISIILYPSSSIESKAYDLCEPSCSAYVGADYVQNLASDKGLAVIGLAHLA